jgi:hypothetical protein
MSDYNVLAAVDDTLSTLLWSNMQHDSVIRAIIPSDDRITRESPYVLLEDEADEENYLSNFLYRIIEDGNMKNRPLQPRTVGLLEYPPLSLDLFYLMTPLTNSDENNHRLLGKAMQVFYDHAIVQGPALQGVLRDTAEELRIILNPLTLEDMMRLWGGLMTAYRLSVAYEVKVIYIDSERETEAERVRRKRLEFRQF